MATAKSSSAQGTHTAQQISDGTRHALLMVITIYLVAPIKPGLCTCQASLPPDLNPFVGDPGPGPAGNDDDDDDDDPGPGPTGS